MKDAEVVLTPGEVARRLGVSPSGLRRLAVIYGEVYGELQKDASGTTRLWSPEALTRLEQARALMAAGQARSIKDALIALERGAEPSPEAAVALAQDGRVVEALGVVAARLEAVLESNRRLEVEVETLRKRLDASGVMLSASVARPTGSSSPIGSSVGGAQVFDGTASDDPHAAAVEGGGVAPTRQEAHGPVDGPLVRAARWLEQRLRGGKG
jgi:DNA-binding transcriptional MerR regulator